MKKKVLKTGIGIVVSLLIIVGCIFGYILYTQPVSIYGIKDFKEESTVPLQRVLSKESIKEDINYLIDIMESTHPIFLEDVPQSYYKAKEELLKYSDESMSVGALQTEVSKYLSSIDDGHTSIRWSENMFLKVKWKYIDGQLRLIENNEVTNKVVKKIGNLDIEEVVKYIEDIFPDENYVALAKNIEGYSKGKLLLENVGLEFSKYIHLTLDNEGAEEVLQVDFIQGSEYIPQDYKIYSEKIDDNIVYIRLGTCEVNDELNKVIEDIKKYLDEGIENFIVDVIDNGGGNSQACSRILEALKMTPGSYGSTVRFSKLAQEQRGYFRKSGNIKFKPQNTSTKNNNVNLYVLTNENTFSSAQMLCVWVSDGGLGTLVGRPSSNMPSNFGDILTFQLKNSKILGVISHKKFIRPDITRDEERVLEPDIYVEYGDDVLKRVVDEINH